MHERFEKAIQKTASVNQFTARPHQLLRGKIRLIDNQLEFNASYLIAVSGGCDSMVCLHIAQQLNLNISVAHVNYGLRGDESDQETSMVEKYCKKENFISLSYIIKL